MLVGEYGHFLPLFLLHINLIFLDDCCPEDSLSLGQFRLLDVDNKVTVPVDTHIRLIVTGESYALIILLNIIRILLYAGNLL